ncbi:MAG: hypothetical protein ACLFQG_07440, partial [Desulfovermiculus sp.]
MGKYKCAPLSPEERSMIDSGKWGPPAVVRELHDLAEHFSRRQGMSRREFLTSARWGLQTVRSNAKFSEKTQPACMGSIQRGLGVKAD